MSWTKVSGTAVRHFAGPLNDIGINPTLNCSRVKFPQPSYSKGMPAARPGPGASMIWRVAELPGTGRSLPPRRPAS